MCFISEAGVGLLYQYYLDLSVKTRLYLWCNSICQVLTGFPSFRKRWLPYWLLQGLLSSPFCWKLMRKYLIETSGPFYPTQ